jgi:hypothetical protein
VDVGSEHVQLEVADASMVTTHVVPMTWAHTMVMASHWVGFTFPGMMLLPARFRNAKLAEAGRDREASHVVGDLGEQVARV